MTNTFDERTRMARRIRALAKTDPGAAYHIFNPVWATGLKRLPGNLIPGLCRYILVGAEPGDFLCATLNNNLMKALGKADEVSILYMFEIAKFLYNDAPPNCFGKPGAVAAWCAEGGALGVFYDNIDLEGG